MSVLPQQVGRDAADEKAVAQPARALASRQSVKTSTAFCLKVSRAPRKSG
jgi:hypothetical protein